MTDISPKHSPLWMRLTALDDSSKVNLERSREDEVQRAILIARPQHDLARAELHEAARAAEGLELVRAEALEEGASRQGVDVARRSLIGGKGPGRG